EHDLVALLDVRASPCGCDEVERLCRSAREDQRRGVDDAEEIRDTLARVVVSLRGSRRQLVGASMRVRVVVLVVLPNGVEYGRWLLRRRRGIQVVQLRTRREKREVGLPGARF